MKPPKPAAPSAFALELAAALALAEEEAAEVVAEGAEEGAEEEAAPDSEGVPGGAGGEQRMGISGEEASGGEGGGVAAAAVAAALATLEHVRSLGERIFLLPPARSPASARSAFSPPVSAGRDRPPSELPSPAPPLLARALLLPSPSPQGASIAATLQEWARSAASPGPAATPDSV